jgi:hypothetical protein
MSTTEKGISRRNLLKKSAAAGAVFWAVPVIESVTSRAAAASGCASFNNSWIYVVYSNNGGVFFSGFSKGDGGAGSCTAASNPHGTKSITCGSVVYEIQNFTGGASTGSITYGATGTENNATFVGSPNCTNFLTLSGGQVTPAVAGVTILAAFCFGAGALQAICPSGNSTCPSCG